VRSEADGILLASGITDGQGRFSIAFEGAGDARVLVLASVHTETYALDIRDCPLANCDGGGLVYASRSATFNGTSDLGDLTVADTQHGAFNIFNVFNHGSDFARENLGSRPPPLTVQWKQGSDTEGGTSYFTTRNNEIYVISTPDDTDEFDDPVLGHEYGHFLENSFSRSDSPGGDHDGSPTDPRLACGEGYGTFVGCTLVDSPIYIDSAAGGTSVTDITDTGTLADPNSPRGMNQLISEFVVAEMLWQLANGGEGTEAQGNAPIFDVLGNYFPSDNLVDRGVGGVDLVDFLDGWFCRGHDARADIMANFTTAHGFPYDYNGPADCR
jgi:hypothetical protein